MRNIKHNYLADGKLCSEVEKAIRGLTGNRHFQVFAAYSCLEVENLSTKERAYGHWGENWTTMQQLGEQDFVHDVLWDINADVKKAIARNLREINVVLVCRSGKHRSVAICRMVRECLVHSGHNIGTVEHLSEPWWGNMCTTCDDCGVRADGKRKPTLEKVIRAWDVIY
jgi:hypothetical protein